MNGCVDAYAAGLGYKSMVSVRPACCQPLEPLRRCCARPRYPRLSASEQTRVVWDPASRTCDYEDKRRDYSAAGIPEYWIIDPAADRVLVLSLESGSYTTAAERRLDEVVHSRLFPAFAVHISSLLAE